MEGRLVGIADGDVVGAFAVFSVWDVVCSLVGTAYGDDVGALVWFSVGGVVSVLDKIAAEEWQRASRSVVRVALLSWC